MFKHPGSILAAAALAVSLGTSVNAQARRARIVSNIDETHLQRLAHGTHPLAQAAFDRGRAPASLPFERMLLVLKPSPDREAELEALLAAQQDPGSKQYHKWLTPVEFGARFGAADADVAKITGWLQGHGFRIGRVANAHNVIEFSGSAAQVSEAFHTEIHSYVVNGEQHWANASDPEIPAAVTSVVAGVATLHNFRKVSQISNIKPQAVQVEAGVMPNFTASNGEHALSPNDFRKIYGFDQGVFIPTGAGATIAVVARSNINISDIQDFKNAFGFQFNLPQIVINGPDPGNKGDGDEAEAVLDTSWSAALAFNATVKLVISASTNTTDGVDLSEAYIVDNNLADVMTESYGACEAAYTPAEAQFYFSLAQQAAAQGITYTVAAGDSGAEGCDDPGSVTVARGPKSVNVLASTPYNIAVGGTQFNEGVGNYWAPNNDSVYASAYGYIPEVAWNESCTAAQCGTNAGIWAGGGGASILFPKPSWQTGVLGIPNDGARDVPDVSFTSAAHDFYLLCLRGSCTTKLGRSYFSGVSGTSAATPAFAAVMALLVESTGSRHGQFAANLYQLAAGESLASCSANTPGSGCIFNDVVVGNNAVPGEVGYGTPNASYQTGVGYDLATGLGSIKVANFLLNSNGSSVPVPKIRTGIDSPSPLNSSVIGLASFSGWALATSGSVRSVAISIDSIPFGQATYGARRSDICSLYTSANCPNVGWSVLVDTTQLANGPHQLDVTVTSSNGAAYTSAATFTVANWTAANPINVNIDNPSAATQILSGAAGLGGWAISDLSAISQVMIAVDGVSYGAANYGGERDDVCNRNPGHIGCPNVGWNFLFDTTGLADGPHTLSVTAQSAGGQYSTVSRDFIVANTPTNTILLTIDTPSGQSGAFDGATGFGGWTVGTTVPISMVTATIDGQPYGVVQYGGTRDDVCQAHSGAPGCPNVGWNLPIDTTQFVNGTHVLQIRAATAAGQFTTATRVFTIANDASASSFAMNIDTPAAQNSILLGQVTFAGWAVQAGGRVTGVKVAIDGVEQGASTYGLNRPDVCAIYSTSSNCPNVGWSFPVDTTKLANGSHTVTITAPANNSPAAGTISSTFTVANWTTSNPMKMAIDRPNAQMGPLSGLTGIGGWVIDQLAAVSNVTVAVDNLSLGNASYGGNRTDACNATPGAIGCPNVGWNYLLDTTLLSDGTHVLAVTGTTAGGQSSTFTTTFQVGNSSSTPVHVAIDIPTTNETLTGLAHVGGWAVNTGGAQVVSVSVLVDGLVNGIASYGGTRTDVCAAYPNGGGCPNVGWNYTLDTTPFANGSHTLEIRALAADGQKYTASQPFVIANQP